MVLNIDPLKKIESDISNVFKSVEMLMYWNDIQTFQLIVIFTFGTSDFIMTSKSNQNHRKTIFILMLNILSKIPTLAGKPHPANFKKKNVG